MQQQLIQVFDAPETKISKRTGNPYRSQEIFLVSGRERTGFLLFLFNDDDAGFKPGTYELGPKCRLGIGKNQAGKDAVIIREFDLVPCKTAEVVQPKTGTGA